MRIIQDKWYRYLQNNNEHSDADTMVKSLAHANTHATNFFKSVITLPQEVGTEAAGNLRIERGRTHIMKNACILGSL